MTDYIPPFPKIELTPEEQARYDRNVTSFLCDAVAEYSTQSGHTNEDAWIHVRRRKQLSIYKSVYGTRDSQVTLFKGSGLIHGPLEDVMDGLYCDTTDDLRACKTLLKYKLVDGSIMNVTEGRSPEAPYRFAGIKWFAAKAAWGLSKHRDVLAYERMGTTTDANGNELAYHVLHSIDHPDWPIDAIKGIKREHQVTCFLYRSHDDTHVECFIWSTVYNLDSVAQRLAEYVVAGTLLNVVGCVNSARAKKYSLLMKHAQHNKWPASSLCHICYGRSFMSTNRPCAGCFQSVCKSCSDYRFIFHVDAKTGRPHQQRFCKLCINNTVIIDSLNFEASIKKARDQNADTDTEVEPPLPPFRSPYQTIEQKMPSSERSFTVVSSDSEDGSEVAALPMTESGLSHFDLGVVEGAPVEELDNLAISMYSEADYHPAAPRMPRYGRTSHSDKDGFLSDLYSLSRSKIHG
ncbi:hypothetical protein BBO99_00002388 [Phytophthora kernoviae]|uniref:FYVE-type domain-containing protein n=2 Tax=Phytophthora kernoviae TaxID=325452 RepID=A0A3R7K211_9STRA|nr:hypothetical protein G195_002724 [Phytophthora kernoviae 00238/432]KAG2531972.1 hypothetical protein JM16_000633 [Phytophthora kernoviae]KAG2532319.1 hypothetical protein JM18_000657 [Phytophthora kernoviae]RLN02100.1 hypothetical protein BBI17_002213 [Phytophthora kernoviae]RLN83130.1 hypothetical protein BBO99_00002388 [Phytophthora kernoviae]